MLTFDTPRTASVDTTTYESPDGGRTLLLVAIAALIVAAIVFGGIVFGDAFASAPGGCGGG